MFRFDIMISWKYIYYAKWFCADLLSDKSLNPAMDFPAITVHKKPEMTECISEAVERTQFVAE